MSGEGFDFSNLFVFDLANNHQGDVAHGQQIAREMGLVSREKAVRGVFKFQFRDLDTFIHPASAIESANKNIIRFQSTKLSWKDYENILAVAQDEGMLTMCTPFDEASVPRIAEMGFDLIKVASASGKDWPLLEAVANSNLPIVASTGGLSIQDIDNLVSFFEHQGSDFALMHCVSIYPTPLEKCNLNQISVLKKRYPQLTIGWSTHEPPEALAPVQIAIAQGAQIFERHVGIPLEGAPLNGYSSTPEEVAQWVDAAKQATLILGSRNRVQDPEEVAALDALRRGVYLRKKLKQGSPLSTQDVFFAMPYEEGQLSSGEWRDGTGLVSPKEANDAILREDVELPAPPKSGPLKDAVHEIKALLNQAGVRLPQVFEVEFSHHYGIPNFPESGATLITSVNREYCKKIVVVLPGQVHPQHYHKLKEETFQVLHGDLTITLDGVTRTLYPGDTCLVLPGVWHGFTTVNGCVVEEISTTHHKNDSHYRDPSIQNLALEDRKTVTSHWGRFQI